MLTVDELITREFELYLLFCRKAALHDSEEVKWRTLAHITFYHLEELRVIDRVRYIPPILNKWLNTSPD